MQLAQAHHSLGLCLHRAQEDQSRQLNTGWKGWGRGGLTQVWLEFDYSAKRGLEEERQVKPNLPPAIGSHARYCHLHFLQYSCCTGNLAPFSEVGLCVCVFRVSGSDAAIKINCFSSLKAISGKPHVIVRSFTALRWTVTHQHAATPRDNGCHQRGVL